MAMLNNQRLIRKKKHGMPQGFAGTDTNYCADLIQGISLEAPQRGAPAGRMERTMNFWGQRGFNHEQT